MTSLKGGFRHALDDDLAEHDDQHRQRDEGGDCAVERRTPASGETNREDDGQRLDRLDGRSEERGPEREELLAHINKMAW